MCVCRGGGGNVCVCHGMRLGDVFGGRGLVCVCVCG